MSLFGKIIRTTVNLAALPIELAKDIVTLGGVATKGEFEPYTTDRLQQLKDEAEDD